MNSKLQKRLMLASKISGYAFLFYSFIFQLAIAKNSYSQSFKEVTITLNLKGASVEEIFSSIEEKTPYYFIYNPSLLSEKRYDFQREEVSVYDILFDIAEKEKFSFRRINNSISVKKATDAVDPKVIDFDKVVSGIVADSETGNPLIGATVQLKGTTIGAITDANGYFEFSVPDDAEILLITYAGYQQKEVNVLGTNSIDILLKPSLMNLDEVVVVGYGAQEKRSLTGSVGQVKAERFESFPVANLSQGLVGQIAGVDVIEASGDPGSNPIFRIRGVNTLTTGNQPLIVLDGVPIVYESTFASINPSDVASVEVLKDAASASIYGSRATNGVILITTKKGGRNEEPEFSVDVKYGVREVPKKIDLVDAYEIAETRSLAMANTWRRANPNQELPANPTDYGVPEYMVPYLNNEANLVNTDWQDEIFQDAAFHNYNISARGGSKATSYFISMGYTEEEGIITSSDFTRYSLRTNIETDFSDKLNFGININPTYSIQNSIQDENYADDGIVLSALVSYPFFPARNADGSLNLGQQYEEIDRSGENGPRLENPVALAEFIDDETTQSRIIANSYLEYQILDGLSVKSMFGIDNINNQNNYFRPSFIGAYTIPADQLVSVGRITTNHFLNWINENTVSFKRYFGKHYVAALAGNSIQRERNELTIAAGSDFPSDNIKSLGLALNSTVDSEISEWSLLSYFTRVSYEFDDRYYLNTSIRTDGSSRFGANSKWGNFPSVSLGWRISNETFFPQNNVLSGVKLRASLGETGNNFIGNYDAIATLSEFNYVIDNQVVTGFAPQNAPNANLTWETTRMTNYGADLEFIDGKVEVSIDKYFSDTDGMLLNVPVPTQSGYRTSITNIGQVENNGLELSLKSNFELGELRISSVINYSTNENKLLALGPDQENIRNWMFSTEIGQPIGSFWGYRSLGVIDSEETLNNNATLPNAEVGRSYLWDDSNEDGVINEDDKVLLGSYFPDYTLSVGANIGYRNWFMSFLVNSVQGHEIMNYLKLWTVNQTNWSPPLRATLDYWSIDNTDAEFVFPDQGRTDNFYQRGDVLIEDGSFIRVSNITLGYNLPISMLNKVGITSAQLLVAAQNPFLFTNYSGYNPEVSSRGNNPLQPGIDYGNNPTAKTYSIGINVNF